MTCKDCKGGNCSVCDWIKSEEHKNCQHEEVQKIERLALCRCVDCGRIVSYDAIIEMVKGEGE